MSSTSHHSSAAASLGAGDTSSASRLEPTQAERTADARKAFLSALGVAGKELDHDLRSRGELIHEDAAMLMKQEKELQDRIKDLAKENEENEKWLEKSKKKLAEFDDLEDVGSDLEDDLADLEAMLALMEDKQKEGKYDSEDKP